MSEANETIADIVAEMRQLSETTQDWIISIKGNVIADRIEAAWKREIVELKRKYGGEEVYCANCGEKLENVMLHKFAFNGNEYDDDFPCEFSSTLMEDGSIGICICTDKNWCGYDLTECEQREDISCPKCGKFPFFDGHIEVEEQDNVFVSCWTKKGVADGIR